MFTFVATMLTQGKRRSDFNHCHDGELLLPFFGGHDGESVDGKCGCQRSLVGVNSHKATTTFRVMHVALQEVALKALVDNNLEKSGWVMDPSTGDDAKYKERALMLTKVMVAEANRHPIGAVLERRGGSFAVRSVVPLVPGDIILRSHQGNPIFPVLQTCCFCDGYSRVWFDTRLEYNPPLAYETALVRYGFYLSQQEVMPPDTWASVGSIGLHPFFLEKCPFQCSCKCEHTTKEENVGRCLTKITCTKCKQSTTIDSSG